MSTAANVDSCHTQWQPLLSGSLAREAQRAVQLIVEDVERKPEQVGPRCLNDLALLYGFLAHVEKSELWLGRANQYVDRACDLVTQGSIPSYALYGGLSGVGWPRSTRGTAIRAFGSS